MSKGLMDLDTVVDVGDDLKTDEKPESSDSGKDSGRTDDTASSASTGKEVQEGGSDPAKTGEDGRQKLVPHQALHEEREKNKVLRQEIAALKNQPVLTPEDREILAELRRQKEQSGQKIEKLEEEEKPPEFMEDPKGYIDSGVSRVLKELKKLQDTGQQLTQQQQAAQQQAQLQYHTQVQEHQFVASGGDDGAPVDDYYQALGYARTVRANQLQMLYPQAQPAQIAQAVAREEQGLAITAVQSGRNPARVAYDYAKAMGYTKAKAPDTTQTGGLDEKRKEAIKDASRSMGASAGADKEGHQRDESGDDHTPELTAALSERFGVKRK